MKNLFDTLCGAALGAGAMYLLDPEQGPERRERLHRAAPNLACDLGAEADRAAVAAGGTLAEQLNRVSRATVGSDVFTHVETPKAAENTSATATDGLPTSRLMAAAAGTALLIFGAVGRHPLARLTRWIGLGLMADGMLHASAAEVESSAPAQAAAGAGPVASPARGQGDDPANWKVAAP